MKNNFLNSKDKCRHEKASIIQVLLSNPPQLLWLCKKCNEKGTKRF